MSSDDASKRAYLREHNVEPVLIAAVSRLLVERPADPLLFLGTMITHRVKH